MTPRSPRCRCNRMAVACLALIAAPVGAQTIAAAEQRVEIIGTTPVPGIGVDREQVPANVQTATGAEIDRSHAADLSSFLARRLGGVHVNEIQNNPFQPDLNYRGFTASPLLGTAQGLSIYLDGVRMNQPFGDVVSWDLIPKNAIASLTLMPGSNPLFGLNTLGGALSVQTKDGERNPGTVVQVLAGNHQRASIEFEHGGHAESGAHWFVSGNRFHDDGWRGASPTDVTQLYAKAGMKGGGSDLWASVALADNKLTGNGLQEQTLLQRDYASIYSKPDQTKNRGLQLTLGGSQDLSPALKLSGVAYWRRIKTDTLNGDVNDDSLDQSVYQPTPAEIAALTAGGYTGVPTSGANASNTPFPYWRCIANALLVDAPAEQCTGVINTTKTNQTNYGLSGQLGWTAQLGAMANLLIVGGAYDASQVDFQQGSELGYVTPDHGITGGGAFGDGVSGGTVDGAPYDTRVDLGSRSHTWSAFASDTLTIAPRLFLTLAARYNHTTVSNRDHIVPGGASGSLDADLTFSRLNPAIGLTFAPAADVTGYAGFNQGSRAPSAVELGCADPENPCKLPNAFAGDPPLKQVIAQTVETGLRSTGAGDTRWSVGIFRTDNRDDILFVSDNAAGFGYFKNFGKTRRQGLEASFSTRVAALTLGFNYTWLDATYRSTEVVDGSANSSNDAAQQGLPGVDGTITIEPGDRIPGQPRHIGKLFAEWTIAPEWSLSGDLSAIGSAPARGNENGQHQPDGVYYLGRGYSPGYAVLNLGGEYKPSAALKWFVQVNNVFDRQYSSAAQLGAAAFDPNGNFLARPFPPNGEGERPLRNSTFYAPGAPRTFWAGLVWQFGE